MAELTPTERLQPSLLDRLTDDKPERKAESRRERVMEIAQLRQSVVRDLEALLNCSNLASSIDLDESSEVAKSVLNYGVPDFTGVSASGIRIDAMERMMLECIKRFEPRLLPSTLKIKAVADDQAMSHNALVFEIKGQIWAQPVAQEFFAKTDVDLEIGLVSVRESLP